MTTRLEDATAAARAGEWRRALDLLDDAPADDAACLELRAEVAYAAGEFEAGVEAWEALHALERDRGNAPEAALAAGMVATFLLIDTGLMATVRGWLRRADRLLEGHDETPAHAVIAMTRGYERFFCGDVDAARRYFAAAIDIGTRLDVAAAVVIGRVGTARLDIFAGDLDQGLDGLHEVATMLMSGEVDPLPSGMMYCELICAAQGLERHDLAAEWTELMHRWGAHSAFGGLGGRCRVHRAELLRMSGPCADAEAEALMACEELRPWMRREFGWPLVELGNTRVRRGDLAGAEAAFMEAHLHAWSPQPGLALLRLEQGRADEAAEMIATAIEHPTDVPWKERPPIGDLRLGPLLDVQSEIAYARTDPETASTAAARLARLAEEYPGPHLTAWAMLATARSELLAGRAGAAVAAAQEAIAAWSDVAAPFEIATARLVLADGLEVAGSRDAAEMERAAARRGFEVYGAELRAERAGASHDTPPPSADRSNPRSGAGGGEVVFVCDGTSRTIGYRGPSRTVKDLKGWRYLSRLVAEPGREFHVLDLVATEIGVLRPPVTTGAHELSERRSEPGLPVLDDQARDAYRRRLADIDDDIEDAHRMNDPARAELAERDRSYLIAELERAVGLGGRARTVAGSAERARTSVTRSIRYALKQLAEIEPELVARLEATIHTGVYCRYQPDAVAPLTWRLVADVS